MYYAAKTPADQAAAQAVARSLSGAVVTALGPTSRRGPGHGGDRDPVQRRPPRRRPGGHQPDRPGRRAAAPTATRAATPTTTPPGAVGRTFLPPTAAVTPLQPWDPRSCTPGGGEGT